MIFVYNGKKGATHFIFYAKQEKKDKNSFPKNPQQKREEKAGVAKGL
jgi:hypothetical protein